MSKKNQLVRSSGGGLVPSRLNRAISNELARIDAQADITAHAAERHIDQITDTTTRAIAAAGYISAVELAVAHSAPHGQHRVIAIADTGCRALQQVVEEAGR